MTMIRGNGSGPFRKLRPAAFSAGLALLAPLPGAGMPAAPPPAAQTAPASRAGTRPVADILARIGQSAGVIAVADSSVAEERMPLPDTAATPETAEQQIDALVKALPRGTTWAKLYLPAPAGGRPWTGDDVAAYAFAQAKLFGKVGAAPAGAVEILGRQVPAERAKELVAELGLKPVYLVTNPSKSATPSALRAGAPDQWQQMTRDQQRQHIQQRAAQVLNLHPAARMQVIQQMRQQERYFDGMEEYFEKVRESVEGQLKSQGGRP